MAIAVLYSAAPMGFTNPALVPGLEIVPATSASNSAGAFKGRLKFLFPRSAALGLGLASLAASLLVVSGPAEAFGPNLNGGTFKLKTVWGGGFALNVGEKNGNTSSGYPAHLYHNSQWDGASRWVFENGWEEAGLFWYTIRNRWSNQCLTLPDPGDVYHLVRQRPCDYLDNRQYWARDNVKQPYPDGVASAPIYNLQDRYNGEFNVLTQFFPSEGAAMVMKGFDYQIAQYWKLNTCPNVEWC